MFWVKGELKILGGTYSNNAAKQGGVFQAAEESTVTIEGGTFEGNTAENGGVVYVISDGALEVTGGVFEGNSADTGGGAFFVERNADIQVRFTLVRTLSLMLCSWSIFVATGLKRILDFDVCLHLGRRLDQRAYHRAFRWQDGPRRCSIGTAWLLPLRKTMLRFFSIVKSDTIGTTRSRPSISRAARC